MPDRLRRDDGVGAALYTAGVRPGSSVAVFGAGAVGTSVIQGARLARAAKIIAVDLAPRKLEWARSFGATHTVNPADGDAVEQIKALTDGHGVDYAFECVGHPEVLAQVLACRDLAGVATLIGVAGHGSTLALDLPRFFDLGGSLRVSWYGDCLPTRDFPLLAELYCAATCCSTSWSRSGSRWPRSRTPSRRWSAARRSAR